MSHSTKVLGAASQEQGGDVIVPEQINAQVRSEGKDGLAEEVQKTKHRAWGRAASKTIDLLQAQLREAKVRDSEKQPLYRSSTRVGFLADADLCVA